MPHRTALTARTARSVVSSLFVLGALGGTIPALADNPATTVTVDAAANRRPINPNIYGVNYADAQDLASLNAPLNRKGGNADSRYNWQLDAHGTGSDWYFETYPDSSGTPSASVDDFVAATRRNGAEPMITIPMIDWLANLGPNRATLAGFSVKKYGSQKETDPWNSDAGNGVSSATGKEITGNDPADAGTLNSPPTQMAWVQHFVTKFGPAATATGIKYYLLDNEPSAWRATHRDVHPNAVTYDEMFDKIVAYATAIRTADATARIGAGEEWGWWPMYYSGRDQADGTSAANSDYNTHGRVYYYPWLLQKLWAQRQLTGAPLIDILTVHGYNDAPNGDDDTAAAKAFRNRHTRILWDAGYQDPAWYGDIGIEGRSGRAVNWLPTLKAWVSQYHPGLQIGITEYNWGDEANLNGATTQADVLGIYGREGVDLATRWGVAKRGQTPTVYYVTHLASQIYRNYDGSNATFGETSVSATVVNPDNLSAFAAVRAGDGALTVMVINKQEGSTAVTLSLANFGAGAKAQAWQINSAAQTSILRLTDVTVGNSSLATTVPSESITLFVLPAQTTSTPPPPPPPPATGGNSGGSSSGGGGGAVGLEFLIGLGVLGALRLLFGHEPETKESAGDLHGK